MCAAPRDQNIFPWLLQRLTVASQQFYLLGILPSRLRQPLLRASILNLTLKCRDLLICRLAMCSVHQNCCLRKKAALSLFQWELDSYSSLTWAEVMQGDWTPTEHGQIAQGGSVCWCVTQMCAQCPRRKDPFCCGHVQFLFLFFCGFSFFFFAVFFFPLPLPLSFVYLLFVYVR